MPRPSGSAEAVAAPPILLHPDELPVKQRGGGIERDGPREEAEQNQQASHQLQNAAEPGQREHRRPGTLAAQTSKRTENLLRTVQRERESGDEVHGGREARDGGEPAEPQRLQDERDEETGDERQDAALDCRMRKQLFQRHSLFRMRAIGGAVGARV